MNPKLSLAFLIAVAIGSWLILSSLRVNTETYVIEGKLQVINGSPVGSKVYFTQERSFPSDFEILNKSVVQSTGAFSTKFNGIPNRPTYIYATKPNHTVARYVLVLGDPEKKETIDQQLYISSLPFTGGLSKLTAEQEELVILAYQDPCFQKFEGKAPLQNINYFQNLNFLSSDCRNGKKKTAFQANLCIDGELIDQPFFFSIVNESETDHAKKLVTTLTGH